MWMLQIRTQLNFEDELSVEQLQRIEELKEKLFTKIVLNPTEENLSQKPKLFFMDDIDISSSMEMINVRNDVDLDDVFAVLCYKNISFAVDGTNIFFLLFLTFK